MYITRESDYAIRVIQNLVHKDAGTIVSATTLSEEETISKYFILRILRKLRKAGIIESYMGSTGGYTLNQAPEDISIKDVIEVIDGPIVERTCSWSKDGCKAYPIGCLIHQELLRIQEELVDGLEGIDFSKIPK